MLTIIAWFFSWNLLSAAENPSSVSTPDSSPPPAAECQNVCLPSQPPPCTPCPPPCCAPPPCPPPCCPAPCPPPCSPCCHFFKNILITGEYLYWQAHEDGLAFAIDGIPNPGPVLDQGSARHLKWRWDQGFRAGIDLMFPCDQWDIFVNYTHFHTHAKGFHADVIPFWETFPAPGLSSLINSADSHWKLTWQEIDADLGRTITFCKNFFLRAFAGATFLRTKDKNEITTLAPSADPTIMFAHNLKNRQRFWAAGPRVGLNVNWYFCPCISVFADGAIALVRGHYLTRRRDTGFNAGGTFVTFVNTGERFCTIRPIFDFKVGGMIEFPICGCIRLYVRAAYEQLLFLKHNQFMRFIVDQFGPAVNIGGAFTNVNGDLSFHGFTGMVGIEF